ncbi:hypothetical protein FSP39_014294 [Pinctada imbricata]|uniref:Reverse transcriptase domain-containing protein n=1 Tax=Pinctada imbricata TaxID=66713 RepID=A0AA89BVP3_PINIB|nr:hypothetical protein FSP39_014294 [Pinctada imbricata]
MIAISSVYFLLLSTFILGFLVRNDFNNVAHDHPKPVLIAEEWSKDALIDKAIVSVWHQRKLGRTCTYPNIRRGRNHTLLFISLVLILNAQDTEMNPGPPAPKYPCQICHKAVTWKQQGVACDDCQQWYHTKCMHMRTTIYESLANISWYCLRCGMPNFTSSFFDSLNNTYSSNSTFSSIDNSVFEHDTNIGPPLSCSSPTNQCHITKKEYSPFKIININFQSIKNKREELNNLISSEEPNIIIGTETWLNSSIHSAEIFLSNYEDIAKTLDDRGQTDIILLDFSKAFDKVPHARLLHKLSHYGLRNNIHQWITNFLSGREQQVVLEGCKSRRSPVQSGVPQGSVLGPLLFLLYINDLPDYVNNGSTVRLFADDCVLYRSITTARDAEKLQQDLEALQRWEKDWLMTFHPQKCQVIHITNKRSPLRAPYSIHGHVLEEVETAKYLGVIIDKSLRWSTHISAVAKKANNTRAFLQRNIYQCPRTTKALCYTTLVRPQMEYASLIWDPHTKTNINQLEMVQRRAARFVTGDYHRTSSVSTMLQQLQWPTLQERRITSRAVMMFRIVNNLVDVPITYLTPTAVTVRGHNQRFLVPYARTEVYQHSFFPGATRIWNSLPHTTVACSSLDTFKVQLQQCTSN